MANALEKPQHFAREYKQLADPVLRAHQLAMVVRDVEDVVGYGIFTMRLWFRWIEDWHKGVSESSARSSTRSSWSPSSGLTRSAASLLTPGVGIDRDALGPQATEAGRVHSPAVSHLPRQARPGSGPRGHVVRLPPVDTNLWREDLAPGPSSGAPDRLADRGPPWFDHVAGHLGSTTSRATAARPRCGPSGRLTGRWPSRPCPTFPVDPEDARAWPRRAPHRGCPAPGRPRPPWSPGAG